MTYPQAPTSRFKQVAPAVLAAVFCATVIRQAGADVTVTPNPPAPDETDAYEVKVDSNGVEITSQTLRPPAPWRFKVVGRNAQGQPMHAKTTADPMKYLFTLPQNGPMAVQGRWRTLAGLDPMSAADLWEPEMDGKLEQVPAGGGGGGVPPPLEADWKVKVKGRAILLAVDSANAKGQGLPPMSEFLNANKAQAPGKIVLCDLNDADNDGVPDYADQTSGGIANPALVPLLVAVPSNADMNGVKVKFTYDGPAEYVAGAWPSTALGRSNDFDYKDYRQARAGALRLWKLSSLADDRKPDAVSKKLIPSGKEVDATQLFAQATAYQQWKYVTLYVEGINPASGNISVQLMKNGAKLRGAMDQVAVTSAELLVGFNGENVEAVNNPGGNNNLLPGTPDVEWHIGDEDQVTKDQGRGYPLWVSVPHDPDRSTMDVGVSTGTSGDANGPVNKPNNTLPPGLGDKRNNPNGRIQPMEVEDTHPFVIKVPPSVTPDKFDLWLRVKNQPAGTAMFLYPQVKDTLAYHQNADAAGQQLNEDLLPIGNPVPGRWAKIPSDKWTPGDVNHYLMLLRAGQDVANVQAQVEVAVALAGQDMNAGAPTKMSGDTFRVLAGQNYWSAVDFWKAPTVQEVAAAPASVAGYDFYNPQVGNAVISVHGYYFASRAESLQHYNLLSRRMYRAGFRGNFVGFAWPSGPKVFWEVPAEFDKASVHAFLVAPQMLKVAETLKAPRMSLSRRLSDSLANLNSPVSGLGVKRLDWYAHSLGNLVSWEVFRNGAKAGDGKIIHRFFGSEPATWSDAFKPAVGMAYLDYDSPSKPVAFNLSAGTVKKVTWRGWFVGDGDGNPLQCIEKYRHGYNPYDDPVWNKMRVNEWFQRTSGSHVTDTMMAILHLGWFQRGSAAMTGLLAPGHLVMGARARVETEIGCRNVRRHMTLSPPAVHLDLRSDYLHRDRDRRPPRLVEDTRNGNDLVRAVPDTLDLQWWRGDRWRTAVNVNLDTYTDDDGNLKPTSNTDEHDALAPAGGTWGWLPWKNEDLRDWDTKQRVRSYLYTHLNLGHGTVFSPLQRQGSAFSTNTNCHNMNRHCNWPDWQHWGSTAQSFPAAQKFFFERLLGSGDVLPKGDDGHAH